MISREVSRTLLEQIFFSASPGICLSKLSKVSNDPGGEKERQKRQFCSLWGGCSSSMSCVGCRQPGNLSVKIVKSVQATRGRKRASKASIFALSGEGVPVPCPVSATGSPEFVCQNCQKCQTTRGRKRASTAVNFAPSSSMFLCRLQAARNFLSKLSKVSNDPGGEKSVKSVTFALSGEGVPVPCSVSATGSPNLSVKTVKNVKRPGSEKGHQSVCSSSMFCVGYRPRFETWVRIRHFAGLSILQCAGRSSSNLWCSKMLAKSLQTALRGPQPATSQACDFANQHLQASEAFWQLAALPSRF